MAFFESAFEPLLYFVDPNKRLYVLYLATSILLGFLVFAKKSGVQGAFKHLFLKKLWFHPSSQIDLQLLFLNSFLRGSVFLVVTWSSVEMAKLTLRFLTTQFPDHQPWDLSYGQGVFLYSVVSFVGLDFSRFLQHYLSHKIPFFWRFHKIHHSAPILTPFTLYRTHPVESIFSGFRRMFTVGLISGLFMFFSPSLIGAYAILVVNDFVFNIFGSNLRHSHVWLSFGPLNHIFISPAQHQIHHSRAEKHMDKNIGFALALWDKMFGTFYQVKSKREFLILGVRGEKYSGLLEALMAPLKKS